LRVGPRVRAPTQQRHPQFPGKRLDIKLTGFHSMRNVSACPEAPARGRPGSGGCWPSSKNSRRSAGTGRETSPLIPCSMSCRTSRAASLLKGIS
jgi:hypothetical protein